MTAFWNSWCSTPDFPHSIRFCIDTLVNSLRAIEQDGRGHHAEELMRLSGRLQASLRYGQIDEIMERDAGHLSAPDSRSLPADPRIDLRGLHPLLGADRSGDVRGTQCFFTPYRHLTKFQYGKPVSESVMEMRMHPRSDSNQRCLSFSFSVSPRCRAFSYRDHLGNNIHHFDIPGEHQQLVIVAESLVEQQPLAAIPVSLDGSAWAELDSHCRRGRLLGDAAAE